MTPFDYREFYRRNLPHIHHPGSTLFTTFRLVGSIPKPVLTQYRNERRLRERDIVLVDSTSPELNKFYREWFSKFDAIMDKAASGPVWLGRQDIRSVVYKKLMEDDVLKYRLDAFSIMTNHVHVVFQPNLDEQSLREICINGRPGFESDEDSLAKIMQSMKGVTARDCNQLLKRRGQFWDHESFDRTTRGYDGFVKAVRYTLKNPVKAGLVRRALDWPGNYLAPRLHDEPWVQDLLRGATN